MYLVTSGISGHACMPEWQSALSTVDASS